MKLPKWSEISKIPVTFPVLRELEESADAACGRRLCEHLQIERRHQHKQHGQLADFHPDIEAEQRGDEMVALPEGM